MLPLAAIVVLLTLGSCIGKSCDEGNDNFFVEISQSLNNAPTPNKLYKDDKYILTKVENTYIDFTCRQYKKGKSITLQWKNNYGFETEPYEDYEKAALRLTIKPDRDDDGLILTCLVFEPCGEKSLSITLDLSSITMNSEPERSATYVDQYDIQKEEDLRNNATCNRTVQFGRDVDRNYYRPLILPNGKFPPVFGINDTVTIVSCIEYLSLGQTQPSTGPKIRLYERRKHTTIFFSKRDPEMSTRNDHTAVTTEETKESASSSIMQRENSVKTGSRNAVAIVSGVLGTIILILISVIIVMWYRKSYRDAPDNAATQIIYAEIEERPPQLPPPRQEEQPYAKILGTLVPKQQPLIRVDQSLYCEITT